MRPSVQVVYVALTISVSGFHWSCIYRWTSHADKQTSTGKLDFACTKPWIKSLSNWSLGDYSIMLIQPSCRIKQNDYHMPLGSIYQDITITYNIAYSHLYSHWTHGVTNCACVGMQQEGGLARGSLFYTWILFIENLWSIFIDACHFIIRLSH